MLWQIILFIGGVISLGYYIVLGISLRKLNSTFAVFWLAAAAGCFLLFGILRLNPQLEEWRGWWLLCLPIFLFFRVEYLIFRDMRTDCEPNLAYIIVLGAHVQGTMVTDSLARRLERAYTYLKENEATKVIVSGGQGYGEDITEAEAMAVFLEKKGIDSARIIQEGKSKTTRENLLFSSKFISGFPIRTGIVSNNFHMYRACQYACKLGYKRVSRLPADCRLLLLPNYAVREFLAVIKYWIIG